MKVKDWYVNVVEELGVIFDRITTAEENNNFLLQILFEEGEQEKESPIRWAHNISLREGVYRTGCSMILDIDVNGAGSEGYTSEILDFCSCCCGEQH